MPGIPLPKIRKRPSLPNSARQRMAIYQAGCHMLLRDLGASLPWKDIAAWAAGPNQPLPLGADNRSLSALMAKKETPP